MSQNKKGFTLIELIIVVIIIGILASIAAPMMQGMTERAKKTEALTALGTIRSAERLYRMEYNSYVTVTDFSVNNPLSKCIAPGALNGRYYSEKCYHVHAYYAGRHSPEGDQYHDLYISCTPITLDSNGYTVVTESSEIWMLEDGTTGEGAWLPPL